jgi:hypothetical protein
MSTRPEKKVDGLLNVRGLMNRESRARSLKLPGWSLVMLEADGSVNGKVWRDMPGQNDFSRACAWWLWKRGLLVLEDERAEAAAMGDFNLEEGGVA